MIPYDLPLDTGICPYHVATVIFKDGYTNITIEADAGIKINKPVFDMYSVKQHKYSFLSAHMKTYLQHFINESKKVKLKIPTVLHLKQDKEDKPDKKTKSNKQEEPIRRSSRLAKASGKKTKRKYKKIKKLNN